MGATMQRRKACAAIAGQILNWEADLVASDTAKKCIKVRVPRRSVRERWFPLWSNQCCGKAASRPLAAPFGSTAPLFLLPDALFDSGSSNANTPAAIETAAYAGAILAICAPGYRIKINAIAIVLSFQDQLPLYLFSVSAVEAWVITKFRQNLDPRIVWQQLLQAPLSIGCKLMIASRLSHASLPKHTASQPRSLTRCDSKLL